MKTIKQEELIVSFLSQFGSETAAMTEFIDYLSEFGYGPKKAKSSITFKHDLHGKQMAKMGVKYNKKTGVSPFFSLRFSACRGYSERFEKIIGAYIKKYPTRDARCTDLRNCNYCKGEPFSHVYTQTIGGETKYHCGAYAVEIPGFATGDLGEIKKLIAEEHEYLMKNEVNDASAAK